MRLHSNLPEARRHMYIRQASYTYLENYVLREGRRSSLIGKEEAGLLCLFFWGVEPRQKVGFATLFWALPEKDANAELRR